MVSLDEAIIIRLKTHGETYEIFVDADNALKYKSGEDIPLSDVLATPTVFRDAKAGDKASQEHLLTLFNLKNMDDVFTEILNKGELHLTTEQKRIMLIERRKQVASIIAANAINPQTKTPHPLSRIEAAMEEARVEIVISKSAKEQVDKVVKKLNPILPIRFEKLQIALHLPPTYAGKLFHILHEFGEIIKEEWKGPEQFVVIEIPAGMQTDLFNKVNGATHGSVETKVIKHD